MSRPRRWDSGHPETVCGKGAKLSETGLIREWLPLVCDKYGIKSIADVGCGDQNWMAHVVFKEPVQVDGYDYSPIHQHIDKFDCTQDILPPQKYDMILCVYVLNHLYEEGDVEKSINNFRVSGIKWLISTFNDIEKFPLECFAFKWHKEKKSGGVTRQWHYGLFKL